MPAKRPAASRLRPMSELRRSRAERGIAWLYTGPLGHLYSACADIAVLWARWAGGRLKERVRRGPRTRAA